jgi:hypothetical protein
MDQPSEAVALRTSPTVSYDVRLPEAIGSQPYMAGATTTINQ